MHTVKDGQLERSRGRTDLGGGPQPAVPFLKSGAARSAPPRASGGESRRHLSLYEKHRYQLRDDEEREPAYC